MGPSFVRSALVLACVVIWTAAADSASAQLVPYNPYAETQESLPPVAADGTLHWGPFYKSAAMQQAYERLWSLGACRGTNRAITVPVTHNKLRIDDLPEASFSGVARGTAGTLEGGLVAFTELGAAGDAATVLVAQLHPAGVTNLRISGPASTACLKRGMAVRLLAEVDEKGRSTAPIRSLEIVSPPKGFVPDPVKPHSPDTVVGEIQRIGDAVITLKVASGKLRRLTLTLSPETVVTALDATRLDLVAPGDAVEVTGRRWTGDGCMGAGTVFASKLTITKAAAETTVALPGQPDQRDLGAR
jgi:hypothetical protein